MKLFFFQCRNFLKIEINISLHLWVFFFLKKNCLTVQGFRLMDVFVSFNNCSFSHADSNAPLDGSRGSGVAPAANVLFDTFMIKDYM